MVDFSRSKDLYTETVKFEYHKLEVTIYVMPEETDTNTAEYCEIVNIFIGDHPDDIQNLFDDETLDEIRADALKQLKERF